MASKPTTFRKELARGLVPLSLLALLVLDVAWVKQIYEREWWTWNDALIRHVWPQFGSSSGGPCYRYFTLFPEKCEMTVKSHHKPDLYKGQILSPPIARYTVTSGSYDQFGPWVPVLLHETRTDEIVDASTELPLDPIETQRVRIAMADWWGGGSGGSRILEGNFDRHVILWDGVLHTLATCSVLILLPLTSFLQARRIITLIRSSRRAKTGHCIKCGYTIQGLPRCPECGTLRDDAAEAADLASTRRAA